MPTLLALRTPIPLQGADDDFSAAVSARQQALLDFYAAGLAAYAGDQDAWQEALARALRMEPENPYFRSF
ncbi:hypothetical protein GCM10010971_26680 [Silvimonas amylolytica]|uniref:Uncharacterized protein n=1 Tax=Silvimonas amylolytica TaxID=449663 RepID=A0ABQ2PPG0_9NEIS|nr:hypothetical protein GCM10010971_26680 [Silvimonas amylolytica]